MSVDLMRVNGIAIARSSGAVVRSRVREQGEGRREKKLASAACRSMLFR